MPRTPKSDKKKSKRASPRKDAPSPESSTDKEPQGPPDATRQRSSPQVQSPPARSNSANTGAVSTPVTSIAANTAAVSNPSTVQGPTVSQSVTYTLAMVKTLFEDATTQNRSYVAAIVKAVSDSDDADLPALTEMIFLSYKDLDNIHQIKCMRECLSYNNLTLGQTPSKTEAFVRDVLQQLIATFYIYRLHDTLSNSASKSSADTEFQRIRKIELCSKKIFSGLKDASQFKDFTKNLQLRRLITPGWDDILTYEKQSKSNPKKTKRYDLVKHFTKLRADDIIAYDFGTTNPKKADASIALFQAIDSSMSGRLRTMIGIHDDDINMSGPKLFYFIAITLMEEATALTCDVTAEVNNLPTTLKETKFDIPTIAPKLQQCLQLMCDAGGNLNGMYTIIKSAFLDIPSKEFQANVTTLDFKLSSRTSKKDPNDQMGTKALLLLKEAPSMVKEVKALGKWKWEPAELKKRKRSDDTDTDTSDLTAFQAIKSSLGNIQAALKANAATHRQPTDTSCPTGPYSYGPHQWGDSGKTVKTEAEFRAFRNGEVSKRDTTYNGHVWKWCALCNCGKGRMGNHSTADHGSKQGGTKKVKIADQTSTKVKVDTSVFSYPKANVGVVETENHIDNSDVSSVASSFDAEKYDE